MLYLYNTPSDNVVWRVRGGEMEKTEEEWVEYFREIEGFEIRAFIERGKRIREFHDAYKKDPWKFGNRWENAARRVVRLSKTLCSYYEAIERVWGRMDEERLRRIIVDLPVDVHSMNSLSRAFECSEELVMMFFENGRVYAEMTREEAADIFHECAGYVEKEADVAVGPEESEAQKIEQKIEGLVGGKTVAPPDFVKLGFVEDVYSLSKEEDVQFFLACVQHRKIVELLAKWVKAYHLDPTLDMVAYIKPIMEEKLKKREGNWSKRRTRVRKKKAKEK